MTQIVTIDSNHIVALFTPDEAALRQAASAGMMSVVNFRAAGENGGLSIPDERRVAEKAGLNYLHHPVTATELDDDHVDNFRRSLDDLPQPVFLHCASGKRAGAMALMAIAAENGWDGATALAKGRDRGFDLSEDEIGTFVKAYADRKAGL